MNFSLKNNLYLFKLLLLNRNNPTAVWLLYYLECAIKKEISENKIKMELSIFCKLTL